MSPTPLPLILREALSDFGSDAVEGWWEALDEPARGEVIQLWEETCFSQPCAARVDARFVDGSEPDNDPELWHSDFYEYLVNHEVFLLEVAPVHICTRHSLARTAAAAGFIPIDFACPLAQEDCPMHRLLKMSPGKAVRLRLALQPDPNPV